MTLLQQSHIFYYALRRPLILFTPALYSLSLILYHICLISEWNACRVGVLETSESRTWSQYRDPWVLVSVLVLKLPITYDNTSNFTTWNSKSVIKWQGLCINDSTANEPLTNAHRLPKITVHSDQSWSVRFIHSGWSCMQGYLQTVESTARQSFLCLPSPRLRSAFSDAVVYKFKWTGIKTLPSQCFALQ